MRSTLQNRLSINDIRSIVRNLTPSRFEELYALLYDPDKQVSDNAAWVLTHLAVADRHWLTPLREELIDEALQTPSVTKCRLILNLLEMQTLKDLEVRTDFLDFCLEGLADPGRPSGVRALMAKLAFEQCTGYPELMQELRTIFEMMEPHTLSPGMQCTRRNMLKRIAEHLSHW